MSDSSENQNIQQDKVEYVPEIDDTNYFKEQDEKFEELHKNLQQLKEENKRQIDVIINSLDDLMASKCIIEQTLDLGIPDDIPIEISNEKLNVIDLLSKVTGVVNESISMDSSSISEYQESEAQEDSVLQVNEKGGKNQLSDKMYCTGDTPKASELSKEEEGNPLVNLGATALKVSKEEEKTKEKSNIRPSRLH